MNEKHPLVQQTSNTSLPVVGALTEARRLRDQFVLDLERLAKDFAGELSVDFGEGVEADFDLRPLYRRGEVTSGST